MTFSSSSIAVHHYSSYSFKLQACHAVVLIIACGHSQVLNVCARARVCVVCVCVVCECGVLVMRGGSSPQRTEGRFRIRRQKEEQAT